MTNVDVSIVNYGAGNIASVVNMVKRLGYSCSVVTTAEEIKQAKKIIIPGVGAFDAGMSNLIKNNLVEALNYMALEKCVPTLGICLGAQLLGKSSDEGELKGLGWLDFKCVKFQSTQTLKVPHMGWNFVKVENECLLTKNLPENSRYYFVHSFFMKMNNPAQALFTTQYGADFTSGVVKDNIYGLQFHPEKSHKFGMALLKNFLEIQ